MQLLGKGQSTEDTFKGWTPLMKACEEGHCEILKALLEARALVDPKNSKGRRALSFAAAPSMGRQPCIPALEMMLLADADLEHKDVRGETARARAVRDGFTESVATIDRFVAGRLPAPATKEKQPEPPAVAETAVAEPTEEISAETAAAQS
jgi:ankyrin repeat protein